MSCVRMANLTKELRPWQEKLQTVEVTPPLTAHKITLPFTRRKVRKDLWKISKITISVKMTINHFYKKSESSMKSEAHTHFSSLVNIQGKISRRTPIIPLLLLGPEGSVSPWPLKIGLTSSFSHLLQLTASHLQWRGQQFLHGLRQKQSLCR